MASRLSSPVLPMAYSSLWSIWATDLLRQAHIHNLKIVTGVIIAMPGSSFRIES